jgi:hypothetical protein
VKCAVEIVKIKESLGRKTQEGKEEATKEPGIECKVVICEG